MKDVCSCSAYHIPVLGRMRGDRVEPTASVLFTMKVKAFPNALPAGFSFPENQNQVKATLCYKGSEKSSRTQMLGLNHSGSIPWDCTLCCPQQSQKGRELGGIDSRRQATLADTAKLIFQCRVNTKYNRHLLGRENSPLNIQTATAFPSTMSDNPPNEKLKKKNGSCKNLEEM